MGKKILVIEDDPSAVRLISYTLEQEGYQMFSAPNGLEGMRKAQSEEPDLIVLDIMLPGIDGFEICHRLRADPQTAQLPILMLSAKAQETDKAAGLKVGADDYITKPADPSEIVSRVQTLLAQKTATKSRIIAFLGSREGIGTTTLVVNVAIALSQKGKQVVVADLCPNQGKVSEQLGLKPERAVTELLQKPIDTINRQDLETALAAHQTGVRVLAIPPSGDHEEISPSNVDLLLEGLREVTDYLLVDLPPSSSELGKAMLTKCDLVIVVTDSKADGLPKVKSTATLLDKLGIIQKRIRAVVIDRWSVFPEVELSKMKPIIEPIIGVSLLEIIPYDTKASLEIASDSPPVMLSNPNGPMAWSIRRVAENIISEKLNNQSISYAQEEEHGC